MDTMEEKFQRNSRELCIVSGTADTVVREQKTLEERISAYGDVLHLSEEMDWGVPQGKEIW